MDIASFTSAYTTVKTLKELGTTLLDAKIDSEAKDRISEALGKLGEIQENLFYIREELINIQGENQALKDQVKFLEEKLDEKGKVQYRKPSYWVVDGENVDGPFCQKCYDSNNKLIRLQGGENDKWGCYENRRTGKKNRHSCTYHPLL